VTLNLRDRSTGILPFFLGCLIETAQTSGWWRGGCASRLCQRSTLPLRRYRTGHIPTGRKRGYYIIMGVRWVGENAPIDPESRYLIKYGCLLGISDNMSVYRHTRTMNAQRRLVEMIHIAYSSLCAMCSGHSGIMSAGRTSV